MYGMGDQFGYSEWFLDALGMLHDHIAPLGVKFIGFGQQMGLSLLAQNHSVPMVNSLWGWR